MLAGRPWWRSPKYWLSLAGALALFLLTTVAPYVIDYFRLRMPFRTSSLVSEAVARANDHDGVLATLGQPVKAGWFVKGYIRDDETGWSEAKIWIPVSGPRGEGSLYASAGRSAGSRWVFSELHMTPADGAAVDLLERRTLSDEAQQLKTTTKLYLVPMGRLTTIDMVALADYYRQRLGLEVAILPFLALDPSAYDPRRHQFVAQRLLASLRRALPDLAADPDAALIGITQQDMYIAARQAASFTFSWRDGRGAVVSAARMRPRMVWLRGLQPLVQTRARKIVTKSIGIMIYGLPPNHDPSSVLYDGIGSVDDLDVMSETFQGLGRQAVVTGLRASHFEAPVTADLKPRPAPVRDAEFPCLAIGSITDARAVPTGEIASCPPDMRWTKPVDTLEVDFRYGTVVVCTSDLMMPDTIPLVLTRCLRGHDNRSRTFGIGGYLAYDAFPVGSRQPYTWSDLILPDGGRVHYARISRGTGYRDAVYEHNESATMFRGSVMRWNGDGWDLTFSDGALWQFPEAYAATRPVESAIRALRDSQGRRLTFERDRHSNLVRLTSPGGQALHFEYDRAHRIARASAGREDRVSYTYDVGGRLATVEDGARRRTRYAWHLTEIRGAHGPDDEPLFSIEYSDGLPSRIVLRGRTTWTLSYALDRSRTYPIAQVIVGSPDGRTRIVKIEDHPPAPEE
jgi:predicted Zn-dependent protease